MGCGECGAECGGEPLRARVPGVFVQCDGEGGGGTSHEEERQARGETEGMQQGK